MSDFTVEIEREDDGRWIGEVVDLPGVLTYGDTPRKQLQRPRLSRSEFWWTGLNTASRSSELERVFSVQ